MQFIKVLIVDDHEVVREGIRKILEFEKDIVVVAEGKNGEEAVKLALKHFPDVILMDISMPIKSGLEATREILSRRAELNIVLLTVYDDDAYVLEAIKAGAVGYLLKDLNSKDLIAGIRKVAKGESLIDSDIALRLLNDMTKGVNTKENNLSKLTERECDVIRAIARGKSNSEIADTLFISERTVKNHITNIFKKINVHDRTQAAIFAIREGLATV